MSECTGYETRERKKGCGRRRKSRVKGGRGQKSCTMPLWIRNHAFCPPFLHFSFCIAEPSSTRLLANSPERHPEGPLTPVDSHGFNVFNSSSAGHSSSATSHFRRVRGRTETPPVFYEMKFRTTDAILRFGRLFFNFIFNYFQLPFRFTARVESSQ